MKLQTKLAGLLLLVTLFVGATQAQAYTDDVYRRSTDAEKMMHKLGRGVVNVLTCWVEVPRNIAMEWERTDPATGLVLGTVKGAGWGFARLATGVYETVTFPLPVPAGYEAMIEPEFVITDIWGDPIPGVTDPGANDPYYPDSAPIYPRRFNF